LFDPHTAVSEALAQRMGRHYPAVKVAIGSRDPAGYDLTVHATPIGMNDGDPMPVDADRLLRRRRGTQDGDPPFLQAAEDNAARSTWVATCSSR
jgi:shikimate dehydrogenase